MAKVLLLDEELTWMQTVGELLRSEGHQVVPVANSQTALERLDVVAPELVIANLTTERARTVAPNLLHKSRALTPPTLVITITGSEAVGTAIEAIRRGAYDYLIKPFTLDELKLRVQRALSYHATLSENVTLRKQLHSKPQFPEIVGVSAKLREALRLIERAADTDSCILICGQPGTGKELIARAVHSQSRRRFAPFVSVSCAEIPDHLMDVELFGQRKSPGTDDVPGLLREAEGGTLFLENVDALSLSLQARLAEVLRDRQTRHPGDLLPTDIDVRILAAAREALAAKVEGGTFLRALFQTLSEIAIALPPLRERAEDIPLLIIHFLESRIRLRTGKQISITPEAVEICCTYPWPGNIRELEQAMEYAAHRAQNGVIEISDLPRSVQQLSTSAQIVAPPELQNLQRDRAECASLARLSSEPNSGERIDLAAGLLPLKQYLRHQEITYLQRTLAQVGGSKERAAELLGISLATMYRKLSEPDTEAA